jgi:hypothetical protein
MQLYLFYCLYALRRGAEKKGRKSRRNKARKFFLSFSTGFFQAVENCGKLFPICEAFGGCAASAYSTRPSRLSALKGVEESSEKGENSFWRNEKIRKIDT